MANENYCLRLNSFGSSIQTTWQQLQNEGDFYDVTLACEDKQIQSHKIVLSSGSPILKKILKSMSNPNPFLYLRGIKYGDLVNLVNFMYQGEVNIKEQDLERFLSTAEDLQVRGLSEHSNEKTSFETYINNMNNSTERKEDVKYCHDIDKLGPDNKYFLNQNIEIMDEGINQVDQNIEPEKSEVNVNKSKLIAKSEKMASLNKNASISCDDCNKPFSSRSALLRHVDFFHKRVKYACDQCDYKATRKDCLKLHVKAVHDGVRFPCNQCEFTAAFKHDVSRHIKKCHL